MKAKKMASVLLLAGACLALVTGCSSGGSASSNSDRSK